MSEHVLLLLLLRQIKLYVCPRQRVESSVTLTDDCRTYLGTPKRDPKAKAAVKSNRKTSGYRWKIFGIDRSNKFGFNKLSNAHQTPDEYPPASSAEGGEGASLIGHDTYERQGGRINKIWEKLGKGNTGWVEPYNWDPARRYVTEGSGKE